MLQPAHGCATRPPTIHMAGVSTEYSRLHEDTRVCCNDHARMTVDVRKSRRHANLVKYVPRWSRHMRWYAVMIAPIAHQTMLHGRECLKRTVGSRSRWTP